MKDNISEILRHCVKWYTLGIETRICKIEKEFGIRKLHKNSVKFSMEIADNFRETHPGYNFLGVCLNESGLMCLDIEGTPHSVEEFMGILEEKSLKIEDYLVETTMNGGLHLYFRVPKGVKTRNIYACSHGNINFDVLFRGKSFTSPSEFMCKSYKFLGRSVFDLNSIMDIKELPGELYFLIKNMDK
jgi:hypothetical protein